MNTLYNTVLAKKAKILTSSHKFIFIPVIHVSKNLDFFHKKCIHVSTFHNSKNENQKICLKTQKNIKLSQVVPGGALDSILKYFINLEI